MQVRVGFVGLGNMGLPMARNLLRAGHQLTVYNRTRARGEDFAREGASLAETPADAAKDAEVLITMLADDSAVEEVAFGDTGILRKLPSGSVHASMSTISPSLSLRLTQAHEKAGQGYVAAPVFGRPEAAAAARLNVVAAGPPGQIERCQELFKAMAEGVYVVSQQAPAANVVKLAGNFLIASVLEALGEAFALVRKSGLEPKQVLEIVNSSIFKSPLYKNAGAMIAEERFEPPGLKLSLGLKDIRLVLEVADRVAVPMPLASIIRDHYLSAVARGWGEIDRTALARVIAEASGLGQKP